MPEVRHFHNKVAAAYRKADIAAVQERAILHLYSGMRIRKRA